VSIPYLFVERIDGPEARVVLAAADSRHALRSLRLRPGDEVTVTDGAGTVAAGRLASGDRGAAVVEVIGVERRERPAPPITIAMAPPGGDRLGWAVQKLGELGVDEVLLIETERTVRRWKQDETPRLLARLQLVAREAAMQSRQSFVTRVRGIASLPEALEAGDGVIAVLMAGAPAPLATALPDRPAWIRLVVGPEGGFSDREARLVGETGAAAARMGSNILRTETAAVVAAALSLARYGRLG
jgi:16S rRNA (uracil1498-N3)-methyltransferase